MTGKPAPDEPVCEHGTALDVHCCGCHSGFLFDVMSCSCLSSAPGGEGLVVEPQPTLPKRGRRTGRVRDAVRLRTRMLEADTAKDLEAYRRCTGELDYLLKVMTPAELSAYYKAIWR